VLGFHRSQHEDLSLIPFRSFDHTEAERQGFPLAFEDGTTVQRFEPWYERKAKKNLEAGRRIDYRNHCQLPSTLPYGFQIEMENL